MSDRVHSARHQDGEVATERWQGVRLCLPTAQSGAGSREEGSAGRNLRPCAQNYTIQF